MVRFVLPRVFCHAVGLPAGAMLKVRTDPGGAEGKGNGGSGGGGFEGETGDAGATGEKGVGGGHVLGRVGADQCVIGLAMSGDWLQVGFAAVGDGALAKSTIRVHEIRRKCIRRSIAHTMHAQVNQRVRVFTLYNATHTIH